MIDRMWWNYSSSRKDVTFEDCCGVRRDRDCLRCNKGNQHRQRRPGAEAECPSLTIGTADKRYEVQFQDKGKYHSETDSLGQAMHYARSLANWNHAAQVFDRRTRTV